MQRDINILVRLQLCVFELVSIVVEFLFCLRFFDKRIVVKFCLSTYALWVQLACLHWLETFKHTFPGPGKFRVPQKILLRGCSQRVTLKDFDRGSADVFRIFCLVSTHPTVHKSLFHQLREDVRRIKISDIRQ